MGGNVMGHSRWLIAVLMLFLVSSGCSDSTNDNVGSTEPPTGSNAKTVIDCALAAVGSRLSKSADAVGKATDLYEKISDFQDIPKAMEYVYGKNAYALTPDEQADLALLVSGLKSCSRLSNVFDEAVRGIFRLELLKGFRVDKTVDGRVCLAPGETPFDTNGQPKPIQELRFGPCPDALPREETTTTSLPVQTSTTSPSAETTHGDSPPTTATRPPGPSSTVRTTVAAHPRVGLDISSGPPGSVVTAYGDGFVPNEPVQVSQSGGPGIGGGGGTVQADRAGRFEMTFRVSDSTPPGAINIHFRQSPNVSVTETFLVTA